MNRIKQRKKPSLLEVIDKYFKNQDACIQFFMQIKYPDGYYCEKCGCRHYWNSCNGRVQICSRCRSKQSLLEGTIFQWCKLPLFKLILGIYLFLTENKGLSAIQLAANLDINYKSALLLNRKLRCLMAINNTKHKLDSAFYEVDVSYFGASGDQVKKQCGTNKQPVLIVLATDGDNKYPRFLKMRPVSKDTGEITKDFLETIAVVDSNKTLNADGKSTFNALKRSMKVINEVVDYDDPKHRMYWLNTITGNIKTQILGIYHGVDSRNLCLFLSEQEWRFNNRKIGSGFWDKVVRMIKDSYPLSNNMIKATLMVAPLGY